MHQQFQAKSPSNVTELKSYLGLLTYSGKCLPNLATTLPTFHDLLQKERPWRWTEGCERAFFKSKKQLQDSPLLVHYDLKKPLLLACDATPYGVGAVISHFMENGEETPIAFASRTLTASEGNYFHIEKEALSIMFGLKKFHSYPVWSRTFTFLTDHQPPLTIFREIGIFQKLYRNIDFFSIFQLYMYARAYVCIWTLQSCRIDEVNQRNSA